MLLNFLTILLCDCFDRLLRTASKITQFILSLGIYQYILQLYISVRDILLMHVLKSRCHVISNF